MVPDALRPSGSPRVQLSVCTGAEMARSQVEAVVGTVRQSRNLDIADALDCDRAPRVKMATCRRVQR